MAKRNDITVQIVKDADTREQVLDVLRTVYRDEKRWTPDAQSLVPREDLESDDIAWFLAYAKGTPIGVTRVQFRLPIDLYDNDDFELNDPSIDVRAFVQRYRIAEVGRFAVLPRHRKRFLVAASLMRAAATATVERGFTHLLTDVFEKDPNTPLGFHQRVLGFETVATHEYGELQHQGRRITMLLDLKKAFARLRNSQRWVFRFLTAGWDDRTLQHLSTP